MPGFDFLQSFFHFLFPIFVLFLLTAAFICMIKIIKNKNIAKYHLASYHNIHVLITSYVLVRLHSCFHRGFKITQFLRA